MDVLDLNLPNAKAFIIHNYVKDTETTFEYLKNVLNWSGDVELPDRRYSNMGIDYLVSSGKFRKAQPFDPIVLKIMHQINEEFNVAMNSCYALHYETGNAELPFRCNVEAQIDIEHPAFSISFGAPRNITFKNVTTHEEYEFLLLDGDLLILSNNCQSNYSYAIKKSSEFTEQRISLSYRRFHDWSFY